tara:strand:+ start:26 stop:628 length:603 start_codon:yes stop_codon:yes gene_type:complete
VPSQKLIKILKSKTLLSDEEIIPLSDAEAWDKVYKAEAIMRAEREEKRQPEVCFSGFNREEREKLETEATTKGLKVRSRVTKFLAYLVIGDMPGEKKIEQAEEQGVQILTIDEYEKLDLFVKKSKGNQPQYLEEDTEKVKKNRKSFLLKHWWFWIMWFFSLGVLAQLPLPEIIFAIANNLLWLFPIIYLIYWVIKKVVKK